MAGPSRPFHATVAQPFSKSAAPVPRILSPGWRAAGRKRAAQFSRTARVVASPAGRRTGSGPQELDLGAPAMGLWTERHLWIAREAAGSSTNRGKTCRRLRRSAGSNGRGHWCPPGNGQRSLVHAAWLRRSQHGNRSGVPGVCGEFCGYRLGPERARRRSRRQIKGQGFRHEARWPGRQAKQAGQAGQGKARGEDQGQGQDGASTEKCSPSQSVSTTPEATSY